jgi:hypothetical protein
MRKLILSFFLCSAACAFAQTAREEIHQDIHRSGSNLLAYETPTKALTPTPKGYEPFFINHYGRHGSRWLLNDGIYSGPIKTLKKAKEANKLTFKGEELLEKLEKFYPCTVDRLGDLTTVGERQHHGIGKRMTENFPEVFKGNAFVDAKSTVVIRCILSMTAECEEITAFNKDINMHNDVSEAFQHYLNYSGDKKLKDAKGKGWRTVQEYKDKLTHPDRFCSVVFLDGENFFKEKKDAKHFMRQIFELCSNMQSHDTDIDLYDLFTEEEAYDLWKITNIDWYVNYGPAPISDGVAPYSQRFLLRNMIETADTIVTSDNHGAVLRFGHEVCVMPLACLLELDSCGREVKNLDELDSKWVNFRIYPMGCNIQLIYYRPKKGNGEILVKALLNEKEATLPIPTDNYPYYSWNKIREYYINKLDAYKED